eukprot:TRINITY_DN848_c0_g1_i1.p1 TRINITY_DN848_c0_g1~~TRINITY_DN848_c0_g1_i1.p1  ORF type:complete len:367 (-),score=72.78 TRINITY_DN848_c0_g1_i1:103-1203(-)
MPDLVEMQASTLAAAEAPPAMTPLPARRRVRLQPHRWRLQPHRWRRSVKEASTAAAILLKQTRHLEALLLRCGRALQAVGARMPVRRTRAANGRDVGARRQRVRAPATTIQHSLSKEGMAPAQMVSLRGEVTNAGASAAGVGTSIAVSSPLRLGPDEALALLHRWGLKADDPEWMADFGRLPSEQTPGISAANFLRLVMNDLVRRCQSTSLGLQEMLRRQESEEKEEGRTPATAVAKPPIAACALASNSSDAYGGSDLLARRGRASSSAEDPESAIAGAALLSTEGALDLDTATLDGGAVCGEDKTQIIFDDLEPLDLQLSFEAELEKEKALFGNYSVSRMDCEERKAFRATPLEMLGPDADTPSG